MRKIVIFMFILIIVICFMSNSKNIVIPNLAIRIRVIANSNSLKDQELKNTIKNEVSSILYLKLKDIDNYNAARKIISNSIPDVKNIIERYTKDFEINYGKNYFPKKEYKGVDYNSGNYESLVIKLGNGNGKNFWCVLFPPLCMIDESKLNDVSYSFYVSELLKKIK